MFQLLCLGTLLFTWSQPSANQDDLFNLQQLLTPDLNARTLKSTEKAGIITEEIRFHSHLDGEKTVAIFAYFSYPKSKKKLPAFIWNQGGLGQATTFWTEFGARRGYATLCIDFPLPGYRSTGGYPINSGLELPADPRKAPIWHGAVALLRAVSYLESRPEVDRQRIGMAGSSWGGFYTTLMAGIDPRLKAAASMFGCGALHLGNQWWDGLGRDLKRDAAFRDRWRTTLDPAWRLPKSKTPIAWFTGTNDQFYWLPAVIESQKLAGGPSHLALLPNWNHALTPELDEQVFRWLDIHLKKAQPFLGVGPLEVRKEGQPQARWRVTGSGQIQRVDLLLSYGAEGNWVSRYWKTLPARMESDVAVVELPGGTLPYLISGQVVDQNGFLTSTPLERIEPAKLGLKERTPPQFDGAALWGKFSKDQLTTLRLHGWLVPTILADEAGSNAAQLQAGKWTSPPLLGVAGLRQRLTCRLRASAASQVKLQLVGRFDQKRVVVEENAQADKKWHNVRIELVWPEALTADVRLVVEVPAGITASLAAVQFSVVPEQ